MSNPIAATLVIAAVLSGIIGAVVGVQKNVSAAGFFLGLFLGPIGIIVALLLDGRHQCPRCHGRLNGEPRVCQHCNAFLGWKRSEYDSPQPYVRTEPEQPPPSPLAKNKEPQAEDRGEQWYYTMGGMEHGPETRQNVLELIRSGRIKSTDSVWMPEMDDWQSVAKAFSQEESVPRQANNDLVMESQKAQLNSKSDTLSLGLVVAGFIGCGILLIVWLIAQVSPQVSPSDTFVASDGEQSARVSAETLAGTVDTANVADDSVQENDRSSVVTLADGTTIRVWADGEIVYWHIVIPNCLIIFRSVIFDDFRLVIGLETRERGVGKFTMPRNRFHLVCARNELTIQLRSAPRIGVRTIEISSADLSKMREILRY